MRRTFEQGVTILSLEGAGDTPKSSTGHKGVHRHGEGRRGYYVRWARTYLGTYPTYEEAVAVREEAEEHVRAGTFEAWKKDLKKRRGKK